MRSVSFPMLSAGLGGLDWEREVCPLLEQYLDPLPVPVYIHLYESSDPFAIHWDYEQLKNWLYTIPQLPGLDRFRADLDALLLRQTRWTRLDNGGSFEVRVGADRSLWFRSQDGREYHCPDSALAALWQFVELAAYIDPADMPEGLDLPPVLLFSLLAKLDYLRPVLLARVGSERHIGLYYVPPLDDDRSRVA